MKLALVVPGGVDRSGRERVIPVLLWLIERLARRHEVHVFALRQYPEPCDYELLGAHIHNIGQFGSGAGLALFQQYRRFSACVDQHGKSFDCFHGFWAGPPGLFAALAARRQRAPCVLSLMGGEVVALPEIHYGMQCHWRSRLLVHWCARLATQVTVATPYMQALAERCHIAADIVPLGASRPVINSDSLPQSLNQKKHLLHVASLNLVKDQTTLLRAMRRILDAGADVQLDIVGEDTLNGAMQRLCTAAGLDANVSFHGFLPQDTLPPLYQAADLFVLPSRHDAEPVVVLEAALYGLPTVGTPVGFIADWAPERARAVPIGDDKALAEAVLALLADNPLRVQMGRQARLWAQAHDADWTANQFESRYQRLSIAQPRLSS